MYAVQIQNFDGKWVTVTEPTISITEAKIQLEQYEGDWNCEARIACVDDIAGA